MTDHKGMWGQEAWRRLSVSCVCVCVWRWEAAAGWQTSESQVFLSQRGEALVQGLVRHLLQCWRVPLRILVLVNQHWKHAENHDIEGESDDVTEMKQRTKLLFIDPLITFRINIPFFFIVLLFFIPPCAIHINSHPPYSTVSPMLCTDLPALTPS